MNLDRLREAEAMFLQWYPQGFADPAIQSIKKKHNVDKLIEVTQRELTRVNCNNPDFVAESLVKIVSRSSMVSRFEKPRFKEFSESLGNKEKKALALAVEKRLYGRKQQGFDEILALLSRYKVAKWAILSVVPFYFAPRREAFVKPTTAKGIIAHLEVGSLRYHATPTWEFYQGYRELIADIKKRVHPSLSPNNAALTGFLMMTL